MYADAYIARFRLPSSKLIIGVKYLTCTSFVSHGPCFLSCIHNCSRRSLQSLSFSLIFFFHSLRELIHQKDESQLLKMKENERESVEKIDQFRSTTHLNSSYDLNDITQRYHLQNCPQMLVQCKKFNKKMRQSRKHQR